MRLGLLAATLGVIILVGAGTVACRSRPPADAGSAAASALASSDAPSPAGPSVPIADGAPPPAVDEVPPTRLRIPAIAVDARVDPVSIDPATNEFAVPPSIDVVGWYRHGPGLSAAAGSVVIAGHVDGAGQGPGAFFRLRDLAVGAEIEVRGRDGQLIRYAVVARETYQKTAIPLDRYFARDGAPRLTLITCGGPFDRSTRSYRDNVVITAVAQP